jgi:hypothetical protein
MNGPPRAGYRSPRLQAPLVDAIQVGVVVRDDPANVWRDGGPQLATLTCGDDGVGDVEAFARTSRMYGARKGIGRRYGLGG